METKSLSRVPISPDSNIGLQCKPRYIWYSILHTKVLMYRWVLPDIIFLYLWVLRFVFSQSLCPKLSFQFCYQTGFLNTLLTEFIQFYSTQSSIYCKINSFKIRNNSQQSHADLGTNGPTRPGQYYSTLFIFFYNSHYFFIIILCATRHRATT